MPTNLPPEYFEVERRYKKAETLSEKIACLEELISTIPKHKGTDKLRADFRRRLSKLKAAAQSKKRTGRRDSAYHIEREGAGQVVVIGPTNVGKSALVDTLTNASPEVSEVPYTTWKPTPGMMPVDDIQVQLVDTPPLDRDFVEPELRELIKRADLILLVVDLNTDPVQQLADIAATLLKYRILPAHMQDRAAADRFLRLVPVIVVVNKYDDEQSDEVFEIFLELLEEDWPLIPVSAVTGRNLERLKQAVFEKLDIIRVYSKAPGKEPDLDAPFVMKKGSTVAEFARKVHQDFYKNLKSARLWGGAGFDGQLVGRDHVLQDGDVVELRI
jgi:hypothetical protein